MTVDRTSEAPGARVRAWDLPTRLFKWALVILVVCADLSQRSGDILYVWHKLNGYAILTLVLFRILWGLTGSTTARWRNLPLNPLTGLRYGLDLVRGRARHYLGHNPLGTWMVIALLVAITLQGATGLYINDDKFAEGPLYPFGTPWMQRAALAWHVRIFPIIMILAGIHILANVIYTFVKKDPLIPAMVTGWKPAKAYEDAPDTRGGSLLLALALFLLSVAIVWGGLFLVAGRGAFR